jgi:hypothetical protein
MIVCGYCGGKGSKETVHVWSDGPGIVQYECPLCEGTGEGMSNYELMDRVVKLKRERAQAISELEHTRTHIALFFMTRDGYGIPEEKPNPDKPGYIIPDPRGTGLSLATSPSPYVETWEEYLKQDAAKAPRYEGTLEEHYREISKKVRERREQKEAKQQEVQQALAEQKQSQT